MAIDISRSYDKVSRQFTASIDFTALQNLSGHFKYNVILVEDGIVWAQNGSAGGPNYVHDWTVRAMMNGSAGKDVVDGTWNQGDIITKNLSYTVPVPTSPAPDIVPDSCRVVVMVYKVGAPIYNNSEIQQAEQYTLISPDYVATMTPASPDVITASDSVAMYQTKIYNEGLMSDMYYLDLAAHCPPGWSQSYTTANGTFAAGQFDSLTVASGDSATISIEMNPNSIEGAGEVTMQFWSKNNLGLTGESTFRLVTKNGADILVVDANDADYETVFTNSLDDIYTGTYGVISRTALHSPEVELGNFKVITWSMGETFPAFYPGEVAALETFLDNGGNLFICGQDIGSDIFEPDGMSQFAQGFYNNYLHAQYVGDSYSFFLLKGFSGDPITDGIEFVISDLYDRSPEDIAPYDNSATGILKFLNGPKTAAIRAETATYKVVYLGIGFEQIPQTAIGDTILSRSLAWFNQGASGIENPGSLPMEFRLEQNYPNPFNPVTAIKYSLARKEQVRLEVYNTVGQKVKTLVNRQQGPGHYSVSFDGGNLASGIYYYRLTAGDFREYKKMVLMK